MVLQQYNSIRQVGMIFEYDPQEKGLFTFYREQAEKEEQIKKVKRLRKEMKEQHIIDQMIQEDKTLSLFPPLPRARAPAQKHPSPQPTLKHYQRQVQ
jgi:hypothetical protein